MQFGYSASRRGTGCDWEFLHSFKQNSEDSGNAVNEKLATVVGKIFQHKAADETIGTELEGALRSTCDLLALRQNRRHQRDKSCSGHKN